MLPHPPLPPRRLRERRMKIMMNSCHLMLPRAFLPTRRLLERRMKIMMNSCKRIYEDSTPQLTTITPRATRVTQLTWTTQSSVDED